MSTTIHANPRETGKTTISNLITADELEKQIKMAGEGIKKKPGLMKSTAASMALVHNYVERIVTAK